jgi:hypothetical protein
MLARVIDGWKRMTLVAKIRRVIAVVGIGVAIWALTPYFYSTRVDEAFPVAAVPAVATGNPTSVPATPSIEPTSVPATPSAEPTSAPATDQMATPTTEPTSVPATPSIEPTSVPTAEPTPAEPVALLRGSFTRIDALHGASGQAVIYRLPDNQLLLRLEGFEATNGPDLLIGLSGHPIPRSNSELRDNGYLELAPLKASTGNQNYALPADLDLGRFKSVTIYCRAFSVMFSSAELQ